MAKEKDKPFNCNKIKIFKSNPYIMPQLFDRNHGIMLHFFIVMTMLFWSSLGQCIQPPHYYQVDLIVFNHIGQNTSTVPSLVPLMPPSSQGAIPLVLHPSPTLTPYHLLPASSSQLRNEYWALNRKPQYQVLFHYSWLQSTKNQQPIALSTLPIGGWNIEGTLSIKQNNYYLLDTNLLFSSPQTAFKLSQKQRLKPNVVYYLDHPQAGMLIKIHAMS